MTTTIAELEDFYKERHRRSLINKRSGTVWVTQQGKVIAIEDMDDNHLDNTIKMLERNKMRDEEERRAEFQEFINNMTPQEREDLIRYII